VITEYQVVVVAGMVDLLLILIKQMVIKTLMLVVVQDM
jgi:hypothetical protein